MDNTQQYSNLMQAVMLLDKTRLELFETEGDSPAWDMVRHASDHLKAQAKEALRAE